MLLALWEWLLCACPHPRDPAWVSRPNALHSLLEWHMWSTAAPGRAGVTVSTPGPWGVLLGLWHSRGFPGRCACHEVGWGRGTPLTSTRQAMRTPSRSEAGLELLTAYYNQLCFQEARFVTPAKSLGLLFHW